MSIFKLIRAFQKAKGRSPSPSELAKLKQQAQTMEEKSKIIKPDFSKNNPQDWRGLPKVLQNVRNPNQVRKLVESGDIKIGQVTKTTPKAPVDPKFKAAVDKQDETSRLVKEFELRNKENAYKSAFRKYKESVDKKPMDSKGILNIYRNLAKYPQGRQIILDDISDIERGWMFNTMGNRSRDDLIKNLRKLYSEPTPPNPFKKAPDEVKGQIEMDFTDWDPKGMKGGGLAYMLGEDDVSRTPAKIGGLMKLLKALSAKSPVQRYKDYLTSVKRRSQAGDMKSLAPELGAITGGGILVNRAMSRKLDEITKQEREAFYANIEKEYREKYKDDPEMLEIMLRGLEKRKSEKPAKGFYQDGGRVPMMYGGDPGFAFEYGGSWADWRDNHQHMMPLMEYIGTKLPKERTPFRTGFDKGGFSKGRRNFLKLAAGLASIPILGKYFKFAKPAAKAVKAVETSNAAGMPAWFPKLVDKVMKEGKDVTKQYSTIERSVVKQVELPESKTKVLVEHNLTTGDTIVDIGMGKHGWESGRYGQPTRLTLTKGEWIEPDISKTGKVKKSGVKTKDEFDVEEAEFTGDAESVKFEESIVEKYGDHASDFTEVEKYATGKNVDKYNLKGTKKREADEWAQGKAEADAERWADEADDFASGGVAKLLGE